MPPKRHADTETEKVRDTDRQRRGREGGRETDRQKESQRENKYTEQTKKLKKQICRTGGEREGRRRNIIISRERGRVGGREREEGGGKGRYLSKERG